MSLITLQRRFNELGRIRLGEKGPKGEPRRLTTFRLTSASRSLLEAAAAIYGGEVREWKGAPSEGYFEVVTTSAELDVLIPPALGEQGPYSQNYELWSGGGAQRRCDGVTEFLSGERCLCDPDDRQCEIMTRVSVMLPRVPGLGVWRLETSGYNAAVELPGTLDLLSMAAQGQRFIPAVLRLEQRTAKRPGSDGKPQTRRFSVPVLDVKGTTAELMSGPRLQVPAVTTGGVDTPSMDQSGWRLQQTTRSIDFGDEPPLPDTDPATQGAESSEPAAPAGPPLSEAAGSPDADAGGTSTEAGAGSGNTAPASLSRGEFQRKVKAAGISPGNVITEAQSLFSKDARDMTDLERGVLWKWLSQPDGLLGAAQTVFPEGVLTP